MHIDATSDVLSRLRQQNSMCFTASHLFLVSVHNDIISPQMLPATFVVNNDGREACFCPLPEDTDGLYVLFFNQGTLHGSKKIRTDAAQLGETVMLPMLFFPENM